MKKRIVLSGLLAAALTLSLTACGGDKMPEETPVPTPSRHPRRCPPPLPRRRLPLPSGGIRSLPKTFTSGDGATVLTASVHPPADTEHRRLPRRDGHQRVVQGRGGQPDAGGRGGL